MTECELVLLTLTAEELDDANRWVGYMDAHWKALTRDERRQGGLPTDGPWHLIGAMRLAVMREMAQRAGADGWYAGQSTTDHPAGRLLELYARRLALNAESGVMPRVSAAGVLEQACAVCGIRKPLSTACFPRPDGAWGSTCHECRRPAAPVYAEVRAEPDQEEWSAL